VNAAVVPGTIDVPSGMMNSPEAFRSMLVYGMTSRATQVDSLPTSGRRLPTSCTRGGFTFLNATPPRNSFHASGSSAGASLNRTREKT
jgi:hypothetical protein